MTTPKITLPVTDRRTNRTKQTRKQRLARLWFRLWPALLLSLAMAACATGTPNQSDSSSLESPRRG
jgi:hypothetical protein